MIEKSIFKKYYLNNLEKLLIGDILNDKFTDYPPN